MDDSTDTYDEFLGEVTHSMDAKGRLVLPADHRALLQGGKLVVTIAQDKCLNVFPLSYWMEVSDELRVKPGSAREARRRARAGFSKATNQELDKQGRINVPSKLREYAGLTDEVVVVGVGNYVELWAPEEWALEIGVSEEVYATDQATDQPGGEDE